jgi:methionyl-tRNA formyltransferase
MRLVFMGTPEFAVPSLRALGRAGEEIAAVVTQPDRPRRSRASPPEPSPVKEEARRHGLPVLQPSTLADPEFEARLRALDPEAILVVAFGQILPPSVLAIPPRWCINLHASILPRYRGAAPIARAIMAGERVTGVTTMKMDRGLDTGDILLQRECAIGLVETTGELTGRLAEIGAGLLVETLALNARGSLEPRPQDPRLASPAPRLSREDGRIDWSRGAEEIARRIRACNPWPIASSPLGGRVVQFLRAEVSLASSAGLPAPAAPGQVIEAGTKRIVIQCRGESRLAILELRVPGGRTLSPGDAVNGRLVRVGDTFAQS